MDGNITQNLPARRTIMPEKYFAKRMDEYRDQKREKVARLNNLLCCPFCGVPAKGTIFDGDRYFVQCESPFCLAQGPFSKSEDQAKRNWNYRATQHGIER